VSKRQGRLPGPARVRKRDAKEALWSQRSALAQTVLLVPHARRGARVMEGAKARVDIREKRWGRSAFCGREREKEIQLRQSRIYPGSRTCVRHIPVPFLLTSLPRATPHRGPQPGKAPPPFLLVGLLAGFSCIPNSAPQQVEPHVTRIQQLQGRPACHPRGVTLIPIGPPTGGGR